MDSTPPAVCAFFAITFSSLKNASLLHVLVSCEDVVIWIRSKCCFNNCSKFCFAFVLIQKYQFKC